MHLELAPVGHGFAFEAGQFGFLALKEKGLREPHPFAIANAHSETGHIHFVIRALGDYTHKLHEQVKVGMLADIYAPHGRFKRMPGAEREIWLGAGVGISPSVRGHPSGSDALGATIHQAATEVDPAGVQIRFCGPKGFLNRARELMKENHIPEKNIHYEFLTFVRVFMVT